MVIAVWSGCGWWAETSLGDVMLCAVVAVLTSGAVYRLVCCMLEDKSVCTCEP